MLFMYLCPPHFKIIALLFFVDCIYSRLEPIIFLLDTYNFLVPGIKEVTEVRTY